MPSIEQSLSKKQILWNVLQTLIIATASIYIYLAKQENLFGYSLAVVLCIIRFFTCPYLGEKNLLKIIFNIYLFHLITRHKYIFAFFTLLGVHTVPYIALNLSSMLLLLF